MDIDELVIEHQRRGFTFDEKTHTYRLDGKRLASVTQACGLIKRPFDAEAAAARVAQREGKTKDAVLASWERGRDRAAKMGTAFHNEAERIALGGEPSVGFRHNERVQAFKKFWESTLAPRLKAVSTEQKVHHPKHPLAGTFDLLARGSTGLWVVDWKTNKKFDTVGKWGSLLAPFDDLCDCKLCFYSVQVSAYRVILEDSGTPTAGGAIVWCPLTGTPVVHEALDLRDRVRQWLHTVDWSTVIRDD